MKSDDLLVILKGKVKKHGAELSSRIFIEECRKEGINVNRWHYYDRWGTWAMAKKKALEYKPEKPKKESKDAVSEVKINELESKLKGLMHQNKIEVHSFYSNKVRIGVIADTHIGSYYTRWDVLQSAYDTFKEEEISCVYHSGDLLDGEKMYRGHEYEIDVHGMDSQIAECVERYPKIKGIKTYFITGNHDRSYWKSRGADIGERIADKRNDMIYLGPEEVDVLIENKDKSTNCIIRLFHPDGGTAYALSYHPQKTIETLAGGQKPDILVIGHFHKSELIPCYRNVLCIQAGTCQSQTPFMRRRGSAAHLGFWILEWTINKPSFVSRFKAEFFAMYEKPKVISLG